MVGMMEISIDHLLEVAEEEGGTGSSPSLQHHRVSLCFDPENSTKFRDVDTCFLSARYALTRGGVKQVRPSVTQPVEAYHKARYGGKGGERAVAKARRDYGPNRLEVEVGQSTSEDHWFVRWFSAGIWHTEDELTTCVLPSPHRSPGAAPACAAAAGGADPRVGPQGHRPGAAGGGWGARRHAAGTYVPCSCNMTRLEHERA